jgi:hypothetical protein
VARSAVSVPLVASPLIGTLELETALRWCHCAV